MKTPLVFLSILSLLILGCSPKPGDEGFYYISGAVDPGIELYVNGNPTNAGFALSLFVVQGENELEHRGDFTNRGFTLHLFKTKRIFSQSYKTVLKIERTMEEANKNATLSFHEPLWWHWRWQDAEDLGGTISPEDRARILEIVDDLCKKVERRDFDLESLMQERYFRLWSDDPDLIAKSQEIYELGRNEISKMEKLVFRRTAPSDLEFFVGSELVMVRPIEKGPIYYLGPESEEVEDEPNQEIKWTYSYSMEAMHFCKLDGDWVLLVPL